MYQYLNALQYVLDNGIEQDDRTGTGCISCFGYQMQFDLQKGFPLLTTKKLYTKGIIHELLWFLKGDTNIKYLNDNNVHIWDAWANENGDLGPVYGKQWIKWGHSWKDSYSGISYKININQIDNAIKTIKENPNSRKNIVSAWNVGELDQMALEPCHCLFHFVVFNNKLNCHLFQRSCDMFLGVPFNIASYSILTHMVAQVCGLQVGTFVHTLSHFHIYKNHIDQVNLQLSRTPKELPKLILNHNIDNIYDFKYEDFKIEQYDPYPEIKAPISV